MMLQVYIKTYALKTTRHIDMTNPHADRYFSQESDKKALGEMYKGKSQLRTNLHN